MRLQSRILLIFLFIVVGGLFYLVDVIVGDIQPNYREALESPVVDLAEVLAGVVASTSKSEVLNTEVLGQALSQARVRQLKAKIFGVDKKFVDVRVYVTDAKGRVLYHSEDPSLVGTDFSQWNDVYKTLQGEYGARTTRDEKENSKTSVFYVAAPIRQGDRLLGVLSVGKPAAENNYRAERASGKVLVFGILTGIACLLAGWLMSHWVFGPLRRCTAYVKALRSGERVAKPSIGGGEVAELLTSFEDLREQLEGKRYVEQYVQTLTHELKSPLSGIRASSELLAEELSPQEREHFMKLLVHEVDRIERLIGNLLTLAKLERLSGPAHVQNVELKDLLMDALESEQRSIAEKGLAVIGVDGMRGQISVDRDLLAMALSSVLRNAVEFSVRGGTIEFELVEQGVSLHLHLRNQGPLIPDYALSRLTERFFSLPRPDTGKKGSGLGLALAQEVMKLHGGNLSVRNRPGGEGVEVVFCFLRATAA